MRYLLLSSLFSIFLACCQDPQMPEPPEPEPELPACATQLCETEDIHLKYFLNGECKVGLYARLDSTGIGFAIDGGLLRTSSIAEGVYITIFHGMDLTDTLWLGNTNSLDPKPSIASAFYYYVEDDTFAGSFDFARDIIDPESYLIIDHFNADTTVLEGRFQCRFTDRSVNPFVGAPDTLRLECGSFKVRRD